MNETPSTLKGVARGGSHSLQASEQRQVLTAPLCSSGESLLLSSSLEARVFGNRVRLITTRFLQFLNQIYTAFTPFSFATILAALTVARRYDRVFRINARLLSQAL